jgi:uncharacterized protein
MADNTISDDALPAEWSDGDKQKAVEPESQRLGPVIAAERIASIDVLRGVAVLGILLINIEFFALPTAIFFNPSVAGGFTGVNLLTWKIDYILFLQKMMAIFSMLFGAGLILMYNRAESVGRSFGGIYYRRVLWLLLFGSAHGYLLWYGDILHAYAVCGLFLYLLRRRSARLLIILGLLLLVVGVLVQVGSGTFFDMLRHEARTAETALAAGETLTPHQQGMSQTWKEMSAVFDPSPEMVAKEIETYRGSYSETLNHRAPEFFMMQTQAFLSMIIWRVAGLMLLGMGLMKLGVFSGKRSTRFYVICIIVGYGIGLPLCGYGAGSLIEHNFDFVYQFKIGGHFNNIGSILVALAYVGMVMVVCKAGFLIWFTRRLAAVGRMAFTNYLMQTLICTTIFYGYGLGLFGRIERFGLMGFVFGIWILQLFVSPIWLKHFRFGLAEWLWRSLTYWRRQPMRVAPTDS